MQTGWMEADGKKYYVKPSGQISIGWVGINNVWYYFNSTGEMQTGWQKVKEEWYYLDKTTGAMKKGWFEDGDSWYYLNASGKMVTGWQTVGVERYYMNSDGVMQTGWLEMGDKSYYLQSSGAMATGILTIDGVKFKFSDNGELIGSISEEGVGADIVAYARQFVGNPYVYGGTSLTNGADCSGFVQSIYKKFGITVRRTSYEQERDGRPITRQELQPGDLVFYYSDYSHVAIYIGDDQIIHAANRSKGITISRINYNGNPTAYRRYW